MGQEAALRSRSNVSYHSTNDSREGGREAGEGQELASRSHTGMRSLL